MHGDMLFVLLLFFVVAKAQSRFNIINESEDFSLTLSLYVLKLLQHKKNNNKNKNQKKKNIHFCAFARQIWVVSGRIFAEFFLDSCFLV